MLLGVTGSVAAFKAAKLASDLVKRDFEVRVIATRGAIRFIAPLTFEALTGNPVATDVWDEQPDGSRMGHLALARWGDVLVVAPASANSIARLALGLADDMLGAVALAFHGRIVIAPAMETGMWQHGATRQHLETLRSRGAVIVGPESGHLASGSEGEGRMSEPEVTLARVEGLLQANRSLDGMRVLITAGPTYEPIDPVRFIGNRSSGKMGYALAEEARDRGARVVLVSGPTSLPPPTGVELVPVESAADMAAAVTEYAAGSNVVIMAAAIADFRPRELRHEKIRRDHGLRLDLVPTDDVSVLAREAAPDALQVGFALDTEMDVDRARDKMRRKGQRLVVVNAVSARHNPFGSDSNRVDLVTEESVQQLPEMSKREIAGIVLDRVAELTRGRD